MSDSALETAATSDRAAAAREAVAANPHWYHTVELAPGVATPGHVDLRAVPARILPADLAGRRALDVGTFDGFWAFELERRGAQVTAIDVERIDAAEWPPRHRQRMLATTQEWDVALGRGFALASEALGSHVRRVPCNVYDAAPERIGGPVDIAFSGAIMLHLRDPVRALERIHECLVPGGEVVILEPFSIRQTLLAPRRPAAVFRADVSDFNWWIPNLACLRAWLVAAGFVDVERRGFHHPPARPEMKSWYVGLAARRPAG